MKLWLITPSAGPEDSRWLDFPVWTEVVVRAESAVRARMVATRMEAEMTADATTAGNETLAFRSGFQDEKLYQVRPLMPTDAQDYSPEGPEEVLNATLASAPDRA